MPIYEFRCQDCSKIFQALMQIGQKGEGLECPVCGSRNIKKIFSSFASSAGSSGSKTSGSSCGPAGSRFT